MNRLEKLREDLLIEILSRLRVKSLIRLSCVSKYWLLLIRSPDFATKHYYSRCSRLQLEFQEYENEYEYEYEYDSLLSLFNAACSISIFSYQNLTFETAFKFRPAPTVVYDPPQFQIYHRDIISQCLLVGPCNGLFFIRLTKGFCHVDIVFLLWNPATRELFKLPLANDIPCSCFGFGFDSVTNDYKVVGVHDRMDPGAVWLYSLATNSWRRLVDPYLYIHYHTILRMGASSSNGRMHNWILTHDLRWQTRDCLLSFDMVDEVFVETPLSLDAPYLNGFLYQGSNNIYPTVYSLLHNIELHIWVLQGYGTTGVWNKQLNITFPQLPRSLRPSYMVLWKKKEIVFISSGTITSLNLTTQEIKSLRIPADGTLIGYTESLVSIAKSIRQPPTMDHSSVETQINVLQHQLPLQLGEEGPVPVDDQQDLSETTMIHQMLPKEDDDSDDSSTDSAFLTPDITAFSDPNTIYIDYEADADFHPHRKNEVQRIFRYASNGNSTGFCRSPLLKVADFSYFFFVGGIAKCSLRLPRSSFQGNCLDDKDEKQHSESQCGKHINEKSQAQSQRPSPSEL